ncbi:MAG: hypothetical protein ACKOAH_09850 [Pirellula sp.]
MTWGLREHLGLGSPPILSTDRLFTQPTAVWFAPADTSARQTAGQALSLTFRVGGNCAFTSKIWD